MPTLDHREKAYQQKIPQGERLEACPLLCVILPLWTHGA
jgi:hypothetical protein